MSCEGKRSVKAIAMFCEGRDCEEIDSNVGIR